jgi:hypothetical protein
MGGTPSHNNSITRVPKPQGKLHVDIFFSHERKLPVMPLHKLHVISLHEEFKASTIEENDNS